MKNTALITGASSGIGLEMAKVFAENGHDLVVVARRKDKLDALAEDLRQTQGVRVIVEVRDLSQESECDALYAAIKAQGVEVDYLINNAGLGYVGRFDTLTWTQQKQMLAVNIDALTKLSDLFVKDMIARKRGHILNVASMAAFQPGPGFAIYCATKAYVLSLSEAMAEELKGLGVRVHALCPGMTESGFFEVAGVEDSKFLKKLKMPSSRDVAEYAFKAMSKNKRVAIHGKLNWFAANLTRLVPRSIVAQVSGKVMRQL